MVICSPLTHINTYNRHTYIYVVCYLKYDIYINIQHTYSLLNLLKLSANALFCELRKEFIYLDKEKKKQTL